MSVRSTLVLTRKSIRARLGRTAVIAIAITIGVSFVVGSFVLADSLRNTFDNLFRQVNQGVDLEIRASVAFGDGAGAERDPVPIALATEVLDVEGVEAAEPILQRFAQFITSDGELVTTQGAPSFGVSWSGGAVNSGLELREGAFPVGPDQVAIDLATARRAGIEVGDSVEVLTDTGQRPFVISGYVSLVNADGFGGASLALFDLPTAREVFGAGDDADVIDIRLADGADRDTVKALIEQILPPGTEVITGEQVAQETSDAIGEFIGIFGNGLLVFAFITAFVSAFIINNVFAITIGQRLRELALLRAVGATGRQVRRMIVVEAVVMSSVATIIGIGGGIVVARLMIAGFNAAGLGFPESATIITGRTVIAAFLVGVGITVASVIVPARRAGRIPPVAAMRPELGFDALQTRKLVIAATTSIIGAAMFVTGLFVRPGGTLGLIAFTGLGALLLFLGIASVSSTVARPVTRLLGWPIAKLFGTPGVLARQNAGRAPRRTAASASALMIGVSLVSAAAVFAASIRDTFVRVLDRAVTADYVITESSFQGLPPTVAETLRELPELAAVSPIRGAAALVDGTERALGAADPSALGQLLDLDIREGGYEGLDDNGILVHRGPADELSLNVGSVLPVTFQNGTELDLVVRGIYADAAVAGDWVISLDTLESASDLPPRDFFVVARLAEGVDATIGDQAVRAALEEFPQVEVQTNAEFRQQQEDQINQLLVVITALLLFAIIIAVLGISITLALSVFERTREIGLLRAVGMNRRQTRRTVRWEAVLVSLFGAIIGIVLGTMIGVTLSLAVPDTIIDGVSFSPGTTVFILIAAVVAGLVAALYPSYKASRTDILRAITTD